MDPVRILFYRQQRAQQDPHQAERAVRAALLRRCDQRLKPGHQRLARQFRRRQMNVKFQIKDIGKPALQRALGCDAGVKITQDLPYWGEWYQELISQKASPPAGCEGFIDWPIP
jgi:hypothetical protein